MAAETTDFSMLSYVTPEKIVLRELFCVIDYAELLQWPPTVIPLNQFLREQLFCNGGGQAPPNWRFIENRRNTVSRVLFQRRGLTEPH